MSFQTFLLVFKFFSEVEDLGSATLSVAKNTTAMTLQEATNQALAASTAATPEISASVLLSIAWVESRHSSNAVSRIENGFRRTGIPSWKSPPKGTRSFFCGVTQISAGDSWRECLKATNVFIAYKTTIKELEQWMSPRICGRNLRCALTGYNGGFPAIRSGSNTYASFVLRRAKLIDNIVRRTQ